MCVQGFTAEYKGMKLVMYRDPIFDIDQLQSAMCHLRLGLSRNNGAKGATASRGLTMTAEAPTCYTFLNLGHYERNCPNNTENNGQGRSQGCGWTEEVVCTRHHLTTTRTIIELQDEDGTGFNKRIETRYWYCLPVVLVPN